MCFFLFISIFIYNHFCVKLVNIYENILEFNTKKKNSIQIENLKKCITKGCDGEFIVFSRDAEFVDVFTI